jgi:Tfp pilus assembly protein PilX
MIEPSHKGVSSRGFTLLIAMVLVSVALAIGLALLDIAYKQVILAAASRQSQVAFYNADTALECALYHDQQENAFSYDAPLAAVTCANTSLEVSSDQSSSPRTRTFSLSCEGGGTSGMVTIYKWNTGASAIFASGYNTCDTTNPRRVERGLKVTY